VYVTQAPLSRASSVVSSAASTSSSMTSSSSSASSSSDGLMEPDKLAWAGFYYAPTAARDDNCVCFVCNASKSEWRLQDDPLDYHLDTCAFALQARNPAPYILHPHPTPYTLRPTPYTRNPTPHTLHPTS
jgi:hypothetical protein